MFAITSRVVNAENETEKPDMTNRDSVITRHNSDLQEGVQTATLSPVIAWPGMAHYALSSALSVDKLFSLHINGT